MAPFIVLVTLLALLSILSHFQIPVAFGWWTSLRLALAGMFLLTASAHWGKRRPDLIRMVPASFPRPDLLVTATGVLEILGAIGLMLPKVAPYAALGLAFMLGGSNRGFCCWEMKPGAGLTCCGLLDIRCNRFARTSRSA